MKDVRTKFMARLRSWWKALAHRSQMESELEAELRFHVESYAQDLVRQGIPREQALRQAKIELGATAVQKEELRSSVGLRSWDDFRADLRYAFRQLRHTPAFTVTVLLVLSLGIGANTAMFSIIDVTLLRWLPYSNPSRLVELTTADAKGAHSWVFYPDLKIWRAQSQNLESLAYYTPTEAFLETKGGQQQVSAYLVSANLFQVLGAQPKLGRAFLQEEETPGKGKVIVLSEPVWQAMFQADPNVVGKQVTLNDQPYTVVGVAPRRFEFPASDTLPQVWVPVEISAAQQTRNFSNNTFQTIARLRKGASVAGAQAELSGIQKQLFPFYSKGMLGELGPSQVLATRYPDTLVRDSRPALLALVAAVGIMWLIACANVANLMLARSMARQREIAVRGALGAGRWRIIRQLFTESLLLSMMGAACGLALAQLALRIFSKTLSAKLSLPEHLTPNPVVLAALLALSVVSALLFGLLPAWLAARTPLEHSLRQGSAQAGAGRGRHRLQQAMVMAEIGLSLVLLIACGLLLRTVFALRRVPLGFRTDHVLTVQPRLPRYKYRGVDANLAVYRPLLETIQQMHGVQAASLTTMVPLKSGYDMRLTLFVGKGDKAAKASTRIDAKLSSASPGLQNVLGFRMYKGRFFTEQDTPDSQLVAVVNKAFADLYSSQGDVMRDFTIGSTKDRQAKIIGVIDDLHQEAINRPSVPEIDFCATQLKPTDGFYQPTMQAHIELAIRTTNDPATFIPDLRRAMVEMNPDLQLSSFATMDQVVEDSMGSQLLAARLLELFAGSALLVALAGLYGLLTYLVAQRNRELGVRIALGAQRGAIIQMLLQQAGRLLVIGSVIGIVLAYFSSRLLASFLYGVKPHDAWTLAGVTALLLLCGLTAAYIPALRASRVDPLHALRGD
jgi:predicted permease